MQWVIPPLRMMEQSEGSAILEVVVDGAYFEPLKTDYKLVSRSVTVEEVHIKEETGVSVKVKANPIVRKQPIQESHSKLLKPDCKKEDVNLTKNILKSYSKLDKIQYKVLKEHVEFNYKPNRKLANWAKKVFKNPDSHLAKMVTYSIEENLNK